MRRVSRASTHDKMAFAHEQRSLPSHGEVLLWRSLRGRQLGVKFRRQHPLGDFVLDFYCEAARLAVEVDGGQHDATRTYDGWRDEQLLALYNVRTMRFTAASVEANLPAVLQTIRDALAQWGIGGPAGAVRGECDDR